MISAPSDVPGAVVVKTYLSTGTLILSSVAAITMNGTCASLTVSRIAKVGPLQLPPWIMNTSSTLISFFTAARALAGSQPSSSCTISILRPLMPPASLTAL